MTDVPDFSECCKLIADTLSEDLQARLLGQPVGDAGWMDEQGDDGHRVRVVSGLIFALKGTYADFGINRWFDRPRQQLNGKAPADILSGVWKRGNADVETVVHLALFHCGPSNNPHPPGLH